MSTLRTMMMVIMVVSFPLMALVDYIIRKNREVKALKHELNLVDGWYHSVMEDYLEAKSGLDDMGRLLQDACNEIGDLKEKIIKLEKYEYQARMDVHLDALREAIGR